MDSKQQVSGFRCGEENGTETHFTRIVAKTWEWLGTVTARWRSPRGELSGRILQQKRAEIFLVDNVQKCENVLESVSTDTEDDVEAFEGDQVGDGDAPLVLLLLRLRLLIVNIFVVIVLMRMKMIRMVIF